MVDFKQEFKDLTHEELIDLLDAYDTYIINFMDDNAGLKIQDDVCPACVMEFYDNEYMNRDTFW